ncbi:unnamed protein product [Closterium sp. NIES-54]
MRSNGPHDGALTPRLKSSPRGSSRPRDAATVTTDVSSRSSTSSSAVVIDDRGGSSNSSLITIGGSGDSSLSVSVRPSAGLAGVTRHASEASVELQVREGGDDIRPGIDGVTRSADEDRFRERERGEREEWGERGEEDVRPAIELPEKHGLVFGERHTVGLSERHGSSAYSSARETDSEIDEASDGGRGRAGERRAGRVRERRVERSKSGDGIGAQNWLAAADGAAGAAASGGSVTGGAMTGAGGGSVKASVGWGGVRVRVWCDPRSLWPVARVLALLLLWYTFSTALSLYNKMLIGQQHGRFPAPLLLTAFHFAQQALMASALLHSAFPSALPPLPLSSRDYCLRVIPTAVATAVDIALSNQSLAYITLTFYTMSCMNHTFCPYHSLPSKSSLTTPSLPSPPLPLPPFQILPYHSLPSKSSLTTPSLPNPPLPLPPFQVLHYHSLPCKSSLATNPPSPPPATDTRIQSACPSPSLLLSFPLTPLPIPVPMLLFSPTTPHGSASPARPCSCCSSPSSSGLLSNAISLLHGPRPCVPAALPLRLIHSTHNVLPVSPCCAAHAMPPCHPMSRPHHGRQVGAHQLSSHRRYDGDLRGGALHRPPSHWRYDGHLCQRALHSHDGHHSGRARQSGGGGIIPPVGIRTRHAVCHGIGPAMGAHSSATAAHPLFFQKDRLGLSRPLVSLAYLTPPMAVTCGLFSLALEPLASLPTSPYFSPPSQLAPTMLLLLLGGVLAFLMIMSEFLLILHTSAVTFSVAGTVKEGATILVSHLVFSDRFTRVNLVGVLIIMIGVSLFNLHRLSRPPRIQRGAAPLTPTTPSAAITSTSVPTTPNASPLHQPQSHHQPYLHPPPLWSSSSSATRLPSRSPRSHPPSLHLSSPPSAASSAPRPSAAAPASVSTSSSAISSPDSSTINSINSSTNSSTNSHNNNNRSSTGGSGSRGESSAVGVNSPVLRVVCEEERKEEEGQEAQPLLLDGSSDHIRS